MLAPLISRNGLGSSIKRRNSKSYEKGRRDSFSIHSSLSLPSSPDSLRRFSSYETLVQVLGSSQQQPSQEEQKQHMTLQPETRLKGRRGSISRLISRRQSIGRKDSDEMKRKRMETLLCDPLDLELAKIREQLAQMKSQDLDMLQRVEDLSHSVDALWSSQQSPGRRAMSHYSSEGTLRMIRESRLESGSLEDLSESSDSEEDNQSFEDYCRTTLPLIGDRRASNTNVAVPTVEIVIGCVDEEDPRQCCVLSSSPYVITQKSSSYPNPEDKTTNSCTSEITQSEPLLHTNHQSCTVTPVY